MRNSKFCVAHRTNFRSRAVPKLAARRLRVSGLLCPLASNASVTHTQSRALRCSAQSCWVTSRTSSRWRSCLVCIAGLSWAKSAPSALPGVYRESLAHSLTPGQAAAHGNACCACNGSNTFGYTRRRRRLSTHPVHFHPPYHALPSTAPGPHPLPTQLRAFRYVIVCLATRAAAASVSF